MGFSLSNIWDTIKGFFAKVDPIIETALTDANKVVNILKTFITSPTGQTVISIIEAFIPGAAVPNAINSIATWLTDIGTVTADPSKAFEDIVAEGLAAINKMTGSSKTLMLSNLAALIGQLISEANGGTSTLEQHIATNQVVYNPNVLAAPATVTPPVQSPNVQTS